MSGGDTVHSLHNQRESKGCSRIPMGSGKGEALQDGGTGRGRGLLRSFTSNVDFLVCYLFISVLFSSPQSYPHARDSFNKRDGLML